MLLAKLLALAIIAAQEAQSIQCRVIETRTNLKVQSNPAAGNTRSASTDVGEIDCKRFSEKNCS